jgi:hypothetical protein
MNALEAKVVAVNRANEFAIKLFRQMKEIFTPYVGKKVKKSNNCDLLETIKKSLPELPNSPSLHVFFGNGYYNLVWTVKASENYGDHFAIYHETDVIVGMTEGNILIELQDSPLELRADYTSQEVLDKREAYKKARKAAGQALSALYPFGEYDR